MGIRYESLDAAVRASMIQEVERDKASGSLYISPRLTDAGARAWPDLLREASEQHDDTWLATVLRSRGYMRSEEQGRKPKGGFTMAAVPHTAPTRWQRVNSTASTPAVSALMCWHPAARTSRSTVARRSRILVPSRRP